MAFAFGKITDPPTPAIMRVPTRTGKVVANEANAASANHAPNENIAIADYVDHIRAFGRFLDTFAGRPL